MTQVRLWTIIGEAQTGKSRAVRELASLPTTGGADLKDVLFRGGGYLRISHKRMAWQEAKRSPAESVADIRARIGFAERRLGASPFAINVLSTLRFEPIEHAGKSCPEGKAYLQAWISEGWSLESIVLMSPDPHGGQDVYGNFGVPTLWLYESRKRDVSQMVGLVRSHFGWA